MRPIRHFGGIALPDVASPTDDVDTSYLTFTNGELKLFRPNGGSGSWMPLGSGSGTATAGSIPIYDFDDIAQLRQVSGDIAIVRGVGLFSLHSGDDDIDDGETCLINHEGNSWRLESVHYDLVEAMIGDIKIPTFTLTAAAIRDLVPWVWTVTFTPSVTYVYDNWTSSEEIEAPGFRQGDAVNVDVSPALDYDTEGFQITAEVIADGIIKVNYINGSAGGAGFSPVNYTVTISESK